MECSLGEWSTFSTLFPLFPLYSYASIGVYVCNCHASHLASSLVCVREPREGYPQGGFSSRVGGCTGRSPYRFRGGTKLTFCAYARRS